MPLMPKRVKFRKSSRGVLRGNAHRGNTVSYGDFGLQSLESGWLSAASHRSRPYHGHAFGARRRPVVHPGFPAQVDHRHPGRDPHG